MQRPFDSMTDSWATFCAYAALLALTASGPVLICIGFRLDWPVLFMPGWALLAAGMIALTNHEALIDRLTRRWTRRRELAEAAEERESFLLALQTRDLSVPAPHSVLAATGADTTTKAQDPNEICR
jgi:hypothetical protein